MLNGSTIWRLSLTDENRFRYIEIKIGILVVAVILFTIIALLYVGYKKDLFAKRISYKVISSTGERLFAGMPVKFEGFRMGEVSKVALNDKGKIVLTLDILKKYQKWIRSDSRVFFNQESMIGNPYLRFTVGSQDKPVMPENSEFILEFEGGIDEIIRQAKPVMEDLRRIVENIRILSDDLSSKKGNFRMFLGSLSKIGEKLESGKGAVPYLFYDHESRDKVEGMLDKFSLLEDSYVKLGSQLNSVVDDKLTPILDDISKSTRNLYLLRRQGEYTLRLGSDLLLKLNNTWPLAPDNKRRELPELPKP
ncbi:mce related protein [bacterium BMS3Abin07]|nr:mce related protein [bacterium BMS3Abin07]GBE31802.1 mce related protein [bacterium BMS3Bbin05]HDO21876.1 MCE family protein [Nitrospirota bacterium]HDZ88608.1 MCE family protein [Nitrospirota bacterium]